MDAITHPEAAATPWTEPEPRHPFEHRFAAEFREMLGLDAAELDARYGSGEGRDRLLATLARLTREAYEDGTESSEWLVHYALYKTYLVQMLQPASGRPSPEGSTTLAVIRSALERAFLAAALRGSEAELGAVPQDAPSYLAWLKDLVARHRAHTHPLYSEYLPQRATREDLQHYLIQESTIDAATDDFLAQLQTGAIGRAKLEMARNYWDEMGSGDPARLHSKLFSDALVRLGVPASSLERDLTTEALACGNLQLMLALQRRHYHRGVGYFGVTEHMAPVRFAAVIQAMRRLGLPRDPGGYYEVHVHVDEDHTRGWFDEVIEPLVAANAAARHGIAEGALLRLRTSARYLDRLLEDFPGRRA